MNADWQLVIPKDKSGGVINLAVGEPHFLQYPEWFLNDNFLPDLTYPPFGGEERLIEAFRQEAGIKKKYIVVTNGAKQAISAAFHALKSVGNYKCVSHSQPYWPSYPNLAGMAGLKFETCRNKFLLPTGGIHVCTMPNNPDGDLYYHKGIQYHIWDAAYAAPIYGFNPQDEPDHLVGVYSAAKRYGAASFRIGFATTDDEQLAKAMSFHVEQTTSGVCGVAQNQLARSIKAIIKRPDSWESEVLAPAREILEHNRALLRSVLRPHCDQYAAENGMFAWFTHKIPWRFKEFLDANKILHVSGDACGGAKDATRFSLGVPKETMVRACALIASFRA